MERILSALARGTNRRRFLAAIGSGAVGGALALMGKSTSAEAHLYHWECCHLCQSPIGECHWVLVPVVLAVLYGKLPQLPILVL